MARRQRFTSLPPPFLKRVWLDHQPSDADRYPLNLPLFRHGFDLTFDRAITIVVGENGVGKSTLLEAIAVLVGFDEAGGGPGYRAVDHSRAKERGVADLRWRLQGAWLPQVKTGWFFRAESFFAVARYLDESGSPYADFLSHSHGEGFMRFFQERCADPGVYVFDEPESALSPARQFDFLRLLRAMQDDGQTQALIATHSPIIMALPGARLLRMVPGGLEPVRLEDTDHFRLMHAFVNDPEGMLAAMIDGAP